MGLLPALMLAVYYLVRLGLDPLHGLWYLSLLVTGGSLGFATVVLGCLLLGIFASVAAIVRARAKDWAPPVAEKRAQGPPVFGPGGHAGPGMLGGTKSALRR